MRLQVHRQQIKWDNLQDAAMIGNKTQRGFLVIFSQNSGSLSWNFDEFGTRSASDQPEELMNKQVQAGKAKNFSEAFDVVFSRPGASKFYFASWMLGRKQEFFGVFLSCRNRTVVVHNKKRWVGHYPKYSTGSSVGVSTGSLFRKG